jgi:hypothetical protein
MNNAVSVIPQAGDSLETLLARVARGLALATGAYGTDYVSNTDAKTGAWFCIYIDSAAVFSLLTMDNDTGTMTGVTHPAGKYLFGQVSAFTLTSGTVTAYRSA